MNIAAVFQGQELRQPPSKQKSPSHTNQHKTCWEESALSAYDINLENVPVNILTSTSSSTSILRPIKPNSAATTTGPKCLWEIRQVSLLRYSQKKKGEEEKKKKIGLEELGHRMRDTILLNIINS